MVKNISWRKALPLLVIGVLSASIVSFAVSAQASYAQNNNNERYGDHHWDGERSNAKYFLKLDGVTGSTNDEKHKGWITLDSYRILEDEPDTPEAQSQTPLAAFGDNNLRFLADASKASPALFEKANTGATIPSATLVVMNGTSKKDYFTLKMTDVIVASYQNSGNPQFGNQDEVVLDYATLTMEHSEGTPVKEGWDYRNRKEIQ